MKILVVDDDDVSRNLLCRILEKLGHTVATASDGEGVLELLSFGTLPQLIFLDWVMPGLSGIDLCRAIRQQEGDKYHHIVLLTSRAETRDITEAIRAGTNDYVTKPIKADELQSRLENALQIIDLKNTISNQRLNMIQTHRQMALTRLTSGLAKAISEPLITIIQQANDMEDAIDRHDEASLKYARDVIAHSAMRIGKSMRSVGLLNPVSNDFTLIRTAEAVDQVVDACADQVNDWGIELRLAPIDRSLYFNGLRSEICQALMDLMLNAIEAVAKLNGPKWVKIDVAESGPQIEIRITDSGPGIAPELRSRVMRPFFTTKKTKDSAGLGLSIAKDIVEAHKGRLYLDEASPQTCFVLALPRAEPQSSAGDDGSDRLAG